ncbi:MAG: sulfite exporter TauE/SafE family protein [Bacteroidetes bacterium]|nr:sulfite exporter TauE/SafE family protein [Bacteroidota bacterium]
MNEVLILLVVGLLAGFLSGLIGIGGGIIIVPVLVYLLNYDQKTAQGTTLFMFLLPIGILGVYNYYKGGFLDYKTALIMAATFIIGSYFGSKTVMVMDTKIVKQMFGAFIILIGIKMLFNK